MRQPKLLYFVSEDWYFCSHRLPLAVAARDAGFDVVVVTRVRDHGKLIREAGLRVIPFEMSRSSMNALRELQVFMRLIGIYRRERPDLVHHVAVKPVIYGSLAARFCGVRNVVNAMAGMGWLFTSSSLKARLIKPIARAVFRILLSPTQVIVQNPDDAALMASTGLRSVHQIRGAGVNIGVFRPAPEPTGLPVVVLPARMLWDKGVGEFVDAARLLKARGIFARFALVGAPDTENPASVPTAQLAAWQTEGVVEWWGQCTDMPAVFAQAHIVCLPSYREGLPKSLLEAAACGLPIVTTNAPGCREIVHDGDNGLTVPIQNALALANALERLIASPTLRRQMGERGRARAVGEFSQTQVIAETLAIYRKALAQ